MEYVISAARIMLRSVLSRRTLAFTRGTARHPGIIILPVNTRMCKLHTNHHFPTRYLSPITPCNSLKMAAVCIQPSISP
jgi:hypothetical protein